MTIALSIDFETLSLETNAVLLALGAVAVDTATGESVADFYAAIDPATQPGRHISASTVYWWLAQNDAARTKLTAAKPLEVLLDAAGPDATDEQLGEVYATAAHPLAHVAQAFMAFYNSLPDQPEVWSNGAVDHAWLQSMFDHAGLKNPVPYFKQRDYRTLKALLPHVVAVKRADFVAHDALHDARYQAEHLVKLLAALPSPADIFPPQPLYVTDGGTVRFRPNRIVDDLLEHSRSAGFGLNEIACCDEYTSDERMQLAQLIGYSVSGYGDLSYASEVSVARADAAAAALLAAKVFHVEQPDPELPDLLAAHVEGAAAEQSAARTVVDDYEPLHAGVARLGDDY